MFLSKIVNYYHTIAHNWGGEEEGEKEHQFKGIKAYPWRSKLLFFFSKIYSFLWKGVGNNSNCSSGISKKINKKKKSQIAVLSALSIGYRQQKLSSLTSILHHRIRGGKTENQSWAALRSKSDCLNFHSGGLPFQSSQNLIRAKHHAL